MSVLAFVELSLTELDDCTREPICLYLIWQVSTSSCFHWSRS